MRIRELQCDRQKAPVLLFLKPCEFEYQAEVRALWQPVPKDATIEPVIVSSPQAAALCSIIDPPA